MGEDDYSNQWLTICILAFIYLAYKFVASIKNSDSQKNADTVIDNVNENSKKVKQAERAEAKPSKEHELNSASKVGDIAKDASVTEQGQQNQDKESVKPNISLRGAFTSPSIPKKIDEYEEDEEVI